MPIRLCFTPVAGVGPLIVGARRGNAIWRGGKFADRSHLLAGKSLVWAGPGLELLQVLVVPHVLVWVLAEDGGRVRVGINQDVRVAVCEGEHRALVPEGRDVDPIGPL